MPRRRVSGISSTPQGGGLGACWASLQPGQHQRRVPAVFGSPSSLWSSHAGLLTGLSLSKHAPAAWARPLSSSRPGKAFSPSPRPQAGSLTSFKSLLTFHLLIEKVFPFSNCSSFPSTPFSLSALLFSRIFIYLGSFIVCLSPLTCKLQKHRSICRFFFYCYNSSAWDHAWHWFKNICWVNKEKSEYMMDDTAEIIPGRQSALFLASVLSS